MFLLYVLASNSLFTYLFINLWDWQLAFTGLLSKCLCSQGWACQKQECRLQSECPTGSQRPKYWSWHVVPPRLCAHLTQGLKWNSQYCQPVEWEARVPSTEVATVPCAHPISVLFFLPSWLFFPIGYTLYFIIEAFLKYLGFSNYWYFVTDRHPIRIEKFLSVG